MTAQPELAPIIHVVQKFLESGGDALLASMYARGELDYKRQRLIRSLNEEEVAYLERHRERGIPIPVALERQNYPTSFFNDRSGEWQGIAADVLRQIEAIAGLHFRPTSEAEGEWANAIASLREGRVAMISELIFTNGRRNDFL